MRREPAGVARTALFRQRRESMQQFDYTVESSKGFEETVSAIEAKSKGKGFSVLAVHNVKATLESKGFSRAPMKIIEICNARYVDQILAKDIKVSLMLPCPIVVYEDEGKVTISALRPRVIADFYPSPGIGEIAAEVDRIILSIVDESR
jgi:uncharacterized protein (DUF302 family)